MEVAVESLRRSMRQEFVLNRTRLTTQTYFEAFESAAFDPADLASLYHENSKFFPDTMGKPRRSVAEFETAPLAYSQAAIGPDHPGLDRRTLPEPDPPDSMSLGRVLMGRRSADAFGPEPLSDSDISTVLATACGITGRLTIDHESFTSPVSKPLRAYPSAGGLYPIEIYLLVLNSADLPVGCYYYRPEDNTLRTVAVDPELPRTALQGFVGAGSADGTPSAIVVLTGALWRGMAKYGPRGYRYALQESGHLAQNILLIVEALGLTALPVGGFYDDTVNDLLDIDGVNETTVYAIVIGPSAADREETDDR